MIDFWKLIGAHNTDKKFQAIIKCEILLVKTIINKLVKRYVKKMFYETLRQLEKPRNVKLQPNFLV